MTATELVEDKGFEVVENHTTIRVFIVDDHPLLCKGVRSVLERQTDFEVCGDAENSDNALRLIGLAKPDIVILDISLKQGDGFDVLTKIRARFKTTKVLVYSGHDESVHAARLLHAGASGYLSKSEPLETLVTALRKVHSGGAYFSEKMQALLMERLASGEFRVFGSPGELLSGRELQIFEMIGEGSDTHDIVAKIAISPKTVDSYRQRIKQKLHLKSSLELKQHAVQWLKQKAAN